MSFVLVSPSTVMRLNETSAASMRIAGRSRPLASRSVTTKPSIVAMFGAIIPLPLARPSMVPVFPASTAPPAGVATSPSEGSPGPLLDEVGGEDRVHEGPRVVAQLLRRRPDALLDLHHVERLPDHARARHRDLAGIDPQPLGGQLGHPCGVALPLRPRAAVRVPAVHHHGPEPPPAKGLARVVDARRADVVRGQHPRRLSGAVGEDEAEVVAPVLQPAAHAGHLEALGDHRRSLLWLRTQAQPARRMRTTSGPIRSIVTPGVRASSASEPEWTDTGKTTMSPGGQQPSARRRSS